MTHPPTPTTPSTTSSERPWSPRWVRVPTKTPIPGSTATGFRTSDGQPYFRDSTTSVIRHVRPKVRGKAARRADKVARRQMQRSLHGSTLEMPTRVIPPIDVPHAEPAP